MTSSASNASARAERRRVRVIGLLPRKSEFDPGNYTSAPVQLAQGGEVVRRQSAHLRRPDIIGGSQLPPIRAEILLPIIRVLEAVHDVRERVGVPQAEGVPELVERGEVDH